MVESLPFCPYCVVHGLISVQHRPKNEYCYLEGNKLRFSRRGGVVPTLLRTASIRKRMRKKDRYAEQTIGD